MQTYLNDVRKPLWAIRIGLRINNYVSGHFQIIRIGVRMQNYRTFLFKAVHFTVLGSHGARARPTGTKEIALQNKASEKTRQKAG